jgi:hypothetical protein
MVWHPNLLASNFEGRGMHGHFCFGAEWRYPDAVVQVNLSCNLSGNFSLSRNLSRSVLREYCRLEGRV